MSTTLLERVDGVVDLIGANAETTERERRLPEAVLAALRDTGIYRTMLPSALGGAELPFLEVIDALERVAAADGSTGWCTSIGTGSNVFSGYLKPEVAAAIWTNPDQGNASAFGPFGKVARVSDGLALKGRWGFSSNCLHSDHIGLGCFWSDGGDPEPMPRLVFVPMAATEVDPTWDALGLCGTGSHDVVVAGHRVERDWSLTFADQPIADGQMFRLPLFCILGPVLGIVPFGIARGAIDEVRQRIIDGTTGRARGSLADDPIALADFAMADTTLRAARAALTESVARAWEAAGRGDPVTKPMQAQIMLALNYGCDVAVEVTSTAHRLGGGSAAYGTSTLLRRLRDVQTARQHIAFGHSARPMLAKALAGEDIFAPPMIV